MPTEVTLPLHEQLLKIMFLENPKKPKAMSPEDLLWKIDNPEITERQIKEVCEWLVYKKKCQRSFGKYIMDRYTFLEQKNLYYNLLGKDSQLESTNFNSSKTLRSKNTDNPSTKDTLNHPYSKNPSVQRTSKVSYKTLFLFLCTISLGLLSYQIALLLEQDNSSFPETTSLETYGNTPIYKPKNIQISGETNYNTQVQKSIANAFLQQNKINGYYAKLLKNQEQKIDSIRHTKDQEIQFLKTQISRNKNSNPALIRNLIFCNLIVAAMFIIGTFFRH